MPLPPYVWIKMVDDETALLFMYLDQDLAELLLVFAD